MTKLFSVKENTRQQETTFVLYMLISSYFHKASCCNKLLEERLLLYYRDMTYLNQIKLEDRVLRDLSKEFKGYEKAFSKMNCQVRILKEDNKYVLLFQTGFEKIMAVVDVKGNYKLMVNR